MLLEGFEILEIQYNVIDVNPARQPRVHAAGAKGLADFLVSGEAQGLIRTFGVDKYDEPLFVPESGP